MKVAFTGTHGTGKTTSVFAYAHSAKLENPNKRVITFHENASRAPKGLFNKKGTSEGQLWIFTNQLQTEITLTHEYDIVVCDRTIFDSIAYTIWMGFDNLAMKMFDLAMDFENSYTVINFKLIKNNNYLYNCEHRDIQDLDYRQRIEEYLLRLYEKSGILGSERFRIV